MKPTLGRCITKHQRGMCSRKKLKFMCTASFSVWASRINQECMNITKNLLVSMTCANLACYYIIRSENTPIETGSLIVSKFEVFRGKWAPSVKNQGNVFWKWNSSIVITDNIFNDIYVFFCILLKSVCTFYIFTVFNFLLCVPSAFIRECYVQC